MGSAPQRGFKPSDCDCHKSEGGKSGSNWGRFRFFWARFGRFSLEFHWRLGLIHRCPQPLISRPLSTTSAHILRLNGLLSIGKFGVRQACAIPISEALDIVSYSASDYQQLCFKPWFLSA